MRPQRSFTVRHLEEIRTSGQIHIAKLEASGDVADLLPAAHAAFEAIRQAAMDVADAETHGAGRLVLVAAAAADGRDAILSIGGDLTALLARRSMYPSAGRVGGHLAASADIAAVSKVLAEKLVGMRIAGEAPCDREARRRAVLCAIEIRALMEADA